MAGTVGWTVLIFNRNHLILEQEDAAIGRLIRERAACERRETVLHLEIRRIGDQLADIARMFQHDFVGELNDEQRTVLDGGHIETLLRERRENAKKLNEQREALRTLGIDR